MGTLLDFVDDLKKITKNKDIVFDINRSVEFLESGCLRFDLCNGGGFPKGRISEVFGLEHSGKSSLLLKTISHLIHTTDSGTAILWDFENAFDPRYARDVYDLVQSDRFIVLQPDDIEEGAKAFEVIAEKVDDLTLMVFDSVHAMRPQAELDRSMDETHLVAAHATAIGRFGRKVHDYCKHTGCTAVFLNQMRYKIQSGKFHEQTSGTGAGFNVHESYTTTGGNFLKYYSSIRVKLEYAAQLKDKIPLPDGSTADTRIGNQIKFINVKNKVFTPFYKTTSLFRFPISGVQVGGWDNNSDLIAVLKNMGYIQQKGPKFEYKGPEHEFSNSGKMEDSERIFLSDEARYAEAVSLVKSANFQQKEVVLDGYASEEEIGVEENEMEEPKSKVPDLITLPVTPVQ